MKSDIIVIDNKGNGHENALAESRKVAVYQDLDPKSALRLQLIAEEVMSLAASVTGELEAEFWIETEGTRIDTHLSTETKMDREKRDDLIYSSTSRKNEAANTFLGWIRDAFEDAMVSEKPREKHLDEEIRDLYDFPVEGPDWDGYERSVLRSIADDVKIRIVGGLVDLTVSKNFA